VNVALLLPLGTVTDGSDAASSTSELASVTTVPPVGALALSVTSQVAEPPLPPSMTVGVHDSEATVWARMGPAAARNASSDIGMTREREADMRPPCELLDGLYAALNTSTGEIVGQTVPRHTSSRQPLARTASPSGGQSMVVKIVPNEKHHPPGKLADAELHFTDGVLEGLKLIGLAG
jgi:hypothetical protein